MTMESVGSESRRAIFFDRDGVINLRAVGDYITRPEEFVLLWDVGPALRRAHQLGYLAVVVTNQRGVSSGRMTAEAVDQVHAEMQKRLEEEWDDRFDAIYVCPHGRDEGCLCRKPEPGMILQAAREIGIDLSGSWIIGDSRSDVEAGFRAGCSTAFILTGEESAPADLVVDSLEEGIEEIARRTSNAK